MDFVGGKAPFQLAHELAKALRAFADRGGQRAVEFAVQKEFPVLGIEAHGVGRQHVDGEIGREPRNVFAVGLGKMACWIVFHELVTPTRAVLLATLYANAIGSVMGDLTRPWRTSIEVAKRWCA